MNRFIQFINREKELEFLEKEIKKPASFTVIYGRRRVGKSELLKEFLKGKKSLYLLAVQEVEKEIINDFSKDAGDFFKDDSLILNPISEFSIFMEYLKKKNLNEIMLVFDEFPYLVDANKAILSILQKYWDMNFREKGAHIILCGSSIGSMETEVLGRKSPLYGRRTGQWKVDPLYFREAMKFFPHLNIEKCIEFYSMSGGIPLYIIELDEKKSIFENARDAFASRGSLLFQEPEIILKEELREPKTYFSILKEVSRGKNTINDLANAIGIERTAITRYMDTLIELDLLEPIQPITSIEKSRKTIYSIKDNCMKFWFLFIYPFKSDLDSFVFQNFQKYFENNFNSYVGKTFEKICAEAIRISNPIKSTNIGTWWGAYREDGERKTAEIDIVSINDETNQILFAECKWKKNVDAMKILDELQEKAGFVDWKSERRKEVFAVFAKSFKERTIMGKNILLYDLDDLEKIFNK